MRKMLLLIAVLLLAGCAVQTRATHEVIDETPGQTWHDMVANQVNADWERQGMHRDQNPAMFDCIVDQNVASYTPDELAALDRFAASRTFNDLEIARAKMQQHDAREQGNLMQRVGDACKHTNS
jgi:uncharacterized lipoprotein YajG